MARRAPASALPPVRVGVALIVQASVFVGLGATLWWMSGRDVDRFVQFDAGSTIAGLLIAAAFIGIGAAVFGAFPSLADELVRQQSETFKRLGQSLPMPLIVAISLSAGIGEEALFRGGVQTWAGDYVGPAGAIIIASALFALMHLSRLLITALLFVIGCLFGALYLFTESLLAVMIGHVLYDIWALRYVHRALARLGYFDDGQVARDGSWG